MSDNTSIRSRIEKFNKNKSNNSSFHMPSPGPRIIAPRASPLRNTPGPQGLLTNSNSGSNFSSPEKKQILQNQSVSSDLQLGTNMIEDPKNIETTKSGNNSPVLRFSRDGIFNNFHNTQSHR